MKVQEEISEEIFNMETKEEVVNGVACVGFVVGMLIEDTLYIQGTEVGVDFYTTKDAFTETLTDIKKAALMGDETANKELRDIRLTVFHAPKDRDVLQTFMHPYLRGGAFISGRYFMTFAMPVNKEVMMPFKAFSLTDDAIASIGIERETAIEQIP